MSSQHDGPNQKPTLPSFQSLLRDIDELGPLNPAAGSPHRRDAALSLSSSSAPRNAYQDRYNAFKYADNNHTVRRLSPTQLPNAPPTTWRPEALRDTTPSPHSSSYPVDHPVSEGMRSGTEVRASSANSRMHPSTGGGSAPSGHQLTGTDDATWRVNVRCQDESPVDSGLTTFTGQMSMRPSVDSAPAKLGTIGPDGRLAKYVCSYCGKRFNRPSSLKIHVNIHTGDRPYICSVPGCERTFSVLSNMRRHTKTHGVSATTPAPPANTESNNKRRSPTKQEIDDELVDELEDDVTGRTPRGQLPHSRTLLNSAKRRKMRGSESTRLFPSRGGVMPEVSDVNSSGTTLRSAASTTISGFDSGSEGDDLDELLCDGPQRQGRKLESPVYTSSDDSDSEKQARVHANTPRRRNTEEYAAAGTIQAANEEDLMVAAGPPISVLRKPVNRKPQGSSESQSSGLEDTTTPGTPPQARPPQPGTHGME